MNNLVLRLSLFFSFIQLPMINAQTSPPHTPSYPENCFITFIQKMPQYKHGTMEDLQQEIREQITYPPDACVEGMMVLSFSIDTFGLVDTAWMARSIYKPFDEQLVPYVYTCEFIPGEYRGKKVPIRMNLPIRIGLQ